MTGFRRKRPRIGISGDICGPDAHFGTFSHGADTRVCAAVWQAGGLPLPIPQMAGAIDDYCDHVDAVILTGGGYQLERSWYVAADPAAHYPVTGRLAFERELLNASLRRGLPLLGICAGMQLLSGHLGGTMTPSIPHDPIDHWRTDSRDTGVHDVLIEENSLLARIVGIAPLRVNSFHQEAVLSVAGDTIVNARAPDGTIEGVEISGRAFVLAVQWHPEWLSPADFRHAAIFSALISEARRRMASSYDGMLV
jgi:putative glutamine amidotransferase